MSQSDGLLAASAGLICLPAAVLTYFVTTRLGGRQPSLVAPLALLGIGARGVAAVGGVLVFDRLLPQYGVSPDGLPGWVAAAYIAALVAESALLVRWVSRRPAEKR